MCLCFVYLVCTVVLDWFGVFCGVLEFVLGLGFWFYICSLLVGFVCYLFRIVSLTFALDASLGFH